MAARNRTWSPVETRMLSEYLATRWAGHRTIQRVRLGSYRPAANVPGLTEAEARMTGVWRRWCDAVVFQDRRVILVECSVFPDPGHVAQLELYRDLWPRTPEFQDYRDWPVDGILVMALPDPMVSQLAARRTLAVEIFRPTWINAYVAKLARRKPEAGPSP